MTKLLDRALEAARNLPDEAQDDVARVISQLAASDEMSPSPCLKEERAAIAAPKEAAARGEFATDEEVAAVWRKHGI